MVCYSSNQMCIHLQQHFIVYLLVLVISTSSHSKLFTAQGRRLLPKTADNSTNNSAVVEEKSIFRTQIGSRPPQCDRRCSWCTHCQAIQVPTNPTRRNFPATNDVVSERSSDEGTSNYKPMSWKCKCGDLIFNP
ncbi:EPIDERMAL PATTERNING FACTOR-like protein 2 [Andrographis paniculata]|uniref:EPIDERMAL PATTERNING FACTOR-like protein 2 n=1 Tax=Andrographis paniculata TaxID=175694 RepID=UPI0021E851A7|nr:EPIDERMAL PATTERNING FACTOR-like protein 2 [Andrographis paniculata]